MHERPRTNRRRRAAALLVALAAGTTALVAAAEPAAAAGGCRSAQDYVVCFTVEYAAPRTYAVHIGLDIHMSQENAQRLVDTYGNGAVIALVYGEDALSSDLLFQVPLSWVAAGPDGLAAEFDVRVTQDQVNEDDNWYDRRDEVIALLGPAEHAPIYSREIQTYF